jgi:hypothetical protein
MIDDRRPSRREAFADLIVMVAILMLIAVLLPSLIVFRGAGLLWRQIQKLS